MPEQSTNGSKSAEGTAAAGHNTANRTEMMSNALSETYKLDQQSEAAMEKHIAPIRDEKRAIKKDLNTDLNITATVFNAVYTAYKVARQAEANDDPATLDNLREFFSASPVGFQMDAFENAE